MSQSRKWRLSAVTMTMLALVAAVVFSLPWQQFAPVTNVFTGATSAAATLDGRCALAFAAKEQAVSADLAKLSGPVTARWFDPTSGESKVIEGSPLPNAGARKFTPAGKNPEGEEDWVLVLEAK